MVPRGHFLCCDLLDAHEVCVLALGTVHGCIFLRECRVNLLRKILWSMPSPLINVYELMESRYWQ